jgi:hypothetical protein
MREIAEKEFKVKTDPQPGEFWAKGFDGSIIGQPKERKLAWSGGKGVILVSAMQSALKEFHTLIQTSFLYGRCSSLGMFSPLIQPRWSTLGWSSSIFSSLTLAS